MSLWIILTGLIIGIISPALAVCFIVPAAGRVCIEDNTSRYKFFIIWYLVFSILYLLKFIDIVQAVSLMLGAGLSCILLFNMIKNEYSLSQILMALLFHNTAFIVLRQYFYSSIINENYLASVEKTIEYLSSNFQISPEQYSVFLDLMSMSSELYLKYNPGIWIATMLSCLIMGYYLLTIMNKSVSSLILYQTHRHVIYSFVLALAITVLTVKYRVITTNYLIATVPLFFLQGLSVFKYKIGHWFRKYKFLIIVAILMMVLNPYTILFISVIGLADNWFDFRNLSKPEAINEDHNDRDN